MQGEQPPALVEARGTRRAAVGVGPVTHPGTLGVEGEDRLRICAENQGASSRVLEDLEGPIRLEGGGLHAWLQVATLPAEEGVLANAFREANQGIIQRIEPRFGASSLRLVLGIERARGAGRNVPGFRARGLPSCPSVPAIERASNTLVSAGGVRLRQHLREHVMVGHDQIGGHQEAGPCGLIIDVDLTDRAHDPQQPLGVLHRIEEGEIPAHQPFQLWPLCWSSVGHLSSFVGVSDHLRVAGS